MKGLFNEDTYVSHHVSHGSRRHCESLEVLEAWIVSAHAHAIAVWAGLTLIEVLVASCSEVAWRCPTHLSGHPMLGRTSGTRRNTTHEVSCVKLIVNISIATRTRSIVGRTAARSARFLMTQKIT